MIRLHDFCGLWRRTLIAWPDGRTDTETAVFWLQGPSHYADLRIPAGRRPRPEVICLRDLDWIMLRFMARQEGFFGCFDIVNSVGQWQRSFDFQPDTGIADRGALSFEDGILVERGIEQPYLEHWSRRPGADKAMALSFATEAGTPGCLVVAGDAFIYARGRTAALPRGATLNQLIDDADSLQAAQDLFDCEISFGRRHGSEWCIERSSHCFREGAALLPVLDCVAGSLVIDDVTPNGARMRRGWRITEYESTNESPLSLWFAPDDASRPSKSEQSITTKTLGVAR